MRLSLLHFYLVVAGAFPMASFAGDEPVLPVENTLGMGDILQVVVSLFLVLLVFISLVWVMRRIGNVHTEANSNLRILEQVSIGQRERLALIEVGDEQVLIGVAPGSISLLHNLKTPVAVNDVKVQVHFSERLADALKRRGK